MRTLIKVLLLLTILPTMAFSNGNIKFKSFSKTKKILLEQIYRDHPVTFYCGCKFTPSKKIIHTNGYIPKKQGKRANRLEWEHVVPAHAFGQSFPEWRAGHPDCVTKKGKKFKGRNCVKKISIEFRYMECDMYNLVPAVGEINGLRSNYSFGMIPGEQRKFGDCDMEIENRKAEPPPHQRGNIARMYFYMDATYSGRGIISKKNRKLFKTWNKTDPVDDWECERCRRIEELQGNENSFVKSACIEKELW